MNNTPTELTDREKDTMIAEKLFGWHVAPGTEKITGPTFAIYDNSGHKVSDGWYSESEAWTYAHQFIPAYASGGNAFLSLWSELERQGAIVEYTNRDEGGPMQFILTVNYDPDKHPLKWQIYRQSVIDGNKPRALVDCTVQMLLAREGQDGT